MIQSDIKKFKDYATEIEFCKGVFSCPNNKVLLIGSNQFKQDILGDKKEIKLDKNEKYTICLCEESNIKDVNKYIKKIKGNIFILENKENEEFILEYKHPSMNDNYNSDMNNVDNNSNNSLRNNNYVNENSCKQKTEKDYNVNDINSIQKEFEESINSFVCEYVEVICSKFKGINKEELYKILYEMFADSYNAGRLASQTELYGLLGNYIEEERQMDNYNNGNGYIN